MKRLSIILIFISVFPISIFSADIFGLYAPPGSISLNTAYEWDTEEALEVQIEHEGVAITDWFMVLDKGQAADYSIRVASNGGELMEYQVYKETAPYTNVIMATDQALTADNVVTSGDFGTEAVSTEIIPFYFYFAAGKNQFKPSGEYTDTLTLSLYKGEPSLPGTHEFVESVSIAVVIRMARLMDIYLDREPGIRSLDLAAAATDVLLAVTHERSNAELGYTVSLTSGNFAANQTGHGAPYMLHETLGDYIEYSLTYGGVAVGGWVSGSSVVTDSGGITDSGTTWLDKELRISYGAGTDSPSGYYQDIITVTITSK